MDPRSRFAGLFSPLPQKLEITVFLRNWSIQRSFAFNSSKISLFLLQWYGGTPCSTAELRGVLKPRPIQAKSGADAIAISRWEAKNLPSAEVQDEQMKPSLAPSSLGLGGICSTETSFNAVLTNYFRECFADEINATDSSSSRQGGAIISGHRKGMDMNDVYDMRWNRGRNEAIFLESLLGRQDGKYAYFQNVKSALNVKKEVKSLASLLDHAENLGHASAPYVEGLTVELLPFQQQSLQWSLERETVRGGVQSFHWVKVPLPTNAKDELYFNPILGMFTKTKPALVKGGMISEQMGLGKTVISLALILSNPAPQLPLSGAPASDIGKAPKPANGASFWAHQQESGADDPKKGNVFSRGTLVVCNVSLVGQWIDEAKSKLRDPGLVYPYHGVSRKRDANLLSKNSIVVTTYETLASDLHYHSKKKGAGYCPPLEQIRWWRVICDESHVMRSSSGKARAVMGLVADNKWLVSGT
jgi:SNF2 family DNA or RNA helicase